MKWLLIALVGALPLFSCSAQQAEAYHCRRSISKPPAFVGTTRASLVGSRPSSRHSASNIQCNAFGDRLQRATQRAAVAVAGAVLLFNTQFALPAAATDVNAIASCLFKNCAPELARCMVNPTCAASVVCINTCNNRPDETECQIKCGDLFGNEVVEEFNNCVVTEKKCVPQRQDDGAYPLPPADAVVTQFDTSLFSGNWYISAGLNELFDIFDCQLHKFENPGPGQIKAFLQWRVAQPVGDFVTKFAVQEFVQDPKDPSILYNHDNEFLHYQDDWYILGFEPEKYVFVYYRGRNDAWDGYGGAVVYTRSPSLPQEYVPALRAQAKKAGLDWDQFALTDNTCRDRQTITQELEKDVVVLETKVAGGLNLIGKEIVKDEQELVRKVTGFEKVVEKNFVQAEKELLKDATRDTRRTFGRLGAVEKEVVKDVVAVEKELVKDVVAVEKELVKDVVAVEREVVKDVIAIEKFIEKDAIAIERTFEQAWKNIDPSRYADAAK